MVNGLPGMQNQVPSVLPRLYPTPVSQYDPNPHDTTEGNSDQQQSPSRPANARTSARKGMPNVTSIIFSVQNNDHLERVIFRHENLIIPVSKEEETRKTNE